MSNFDQPDTAATSLIHGGHSTAGSKVQHRKPDLRTRLRGNARATRKGLNPGSSLFPMKIGLRKVPRQNLAARPDAAMIRNARQGVMSKFLPSGIIIRASDLGSMVNPRSAIITLTDSVEMETDHLSDEEDSMPESEGTLENLFYIYVQGDELPSYHFRRGKDDPDPMHVHSRIDLHGIVPSDSIAEMQPAEYEQAREERHGERAVLTEKMQSFSIRNEKIKGGKFYSQLRSQAAGKATDDAQWQHEAALPSISYESSDKRKVLGTGQTSPQPADSEWETSLLNF